MGKSPLSRFPKAAGAEPLGDRRNEKLHAAVAHFKSKCTKHTRIGPLLEVEKSARGCGAKHISKSTCTKHTRIGPLLEVEMSKSARGCGAKHV